MRIFNPGARNWMTFLDDNRTVNAAIYRYSKETHPDDFYDPAHTIIQKHLDPDKLGTEVQTEYSFGYDSHFQVFFLPINCKKFKFSNSDETSFFEVFLPDQKKTRACLRLVQDVH
jgi:hypothetical protein